jgi:hypothetical protein
MSNSSSANFTLSPSDFSTPINTSLQALDDAAWRNASGLDCWWPLSDPKQMTVENRDCLALLQQDVQDEGAY